MDPPQPLPMKRESADLARALVTRLFEFHNQASRGQIPSLSSCDKAQVLFYKENAELISKMRKVKRGVFEHFAAWTVLILTLDALCICLLYTSPSPRDA